MQKPLLKISLSLNIILIIMVVLLNDSNQSNYSIRKFVDESRASDIKIMEKLVIGKISKEEAIKLLEKEEGFFDKPEDNGIGAGTFFLVFDKSNMLSKIITSSSEGP